jgi:outer membrane immunogenic protein
MILEFGGQVMWRWGTVWFATIFLTCFVGLTDAGAVVVTTDLVTEGEPVPNAEITFETAAGEPVDLFVTETEEVPQEQASSVPPEVTTPSEAPPPKSVPEPAASGTPTGSEQPEEGQEVAVPAESGTASEPREETASGATPSKKEVVTSVSTNADGQAEFEIDDRYLGQSLVLVIKKDGREIERRRVVISKGSLDLSVDVPAAILTGVPVQQSQASSYQEPDYGTETETARSSDSGSTSSTPSYEPSSAAIVTDSSVQSEDGWIGTYWGLSVGLGAGRSESELDHEGREERTSPDWKVGAVEDVYIGANTRLTSRVLVGVQVEGSLSQMNFDSKVDEGAGIRETAEGHEMTRLDLEWMVSVIGRAGWLATPNTFLYGLAGWTYGHFNVDDLVWQSGFERLDDFGSHGFTVGGGAEKKLSPEWSLRAEYRYTNFSEESFSLRAVSAPGAASEPLRGSFENDMHVGRVGATRYFSLGFY